MQTGQWREDLGIDFHIVVVPDSDEPIEQLSDALFQLREVGRDAPTGGLLLVVNRSANTAHLQPSYGLEAAFTDAVIARLVRDQLAPYASYSVLGMAVMDVLHLLKDVVWLHAAQGDFEFAKKYQKRAEYEEARRYLAGGGGARSSWSETQADRDPKDRVPDQRRAHYAPSSDPLESTAALMRVQRDLVGDPSLVLFTPGSRVQRASYPFAAYEQLRHLESLEASKPFSVELQGDRAVVMSKSPTRDFLPVLLHRVDGLWLVDLVETFKNLGFTREGRWVESNSNHPYHYALQKLGPGSLEDIGALDLGGADPQILLERMSGQEGAFFRYLEGEILFRNCFVFPEAIARYERAVELAPDSPLFARVLGDRARMVGFHELAASAYAKVGRAARLDRAEALTRIQRSKQAIELASEALQDDPYDVRAMSLLSAWVKKDDPERAQLLRIRMNAVLTDVRRDHGSLQVRFQPARPELRVDESKRSGGSLLTDYSDFSVTFVNHSGKAVRLEEVIVTARGTSSREILGDVTDQLTRARPGRVIPPGEAVTLDRTWGLEVESEHQQISYVFDYCWRTLDGIDRRCRSEIVDTFPL
jgi:tetratricopeptide (TPR) repeat protein